MKIQSKLTAFILLLLSSFSYSEIVNDTRNLDQVTRIMSFGDSLTYGFRLDRDVTYSAQLGNILGVPILNRGRNGLTTQQALGSNGHISTSLREMPNPQIVIMTLGGNDIMNDRRRTNQIKNNMRSVFQAFQDRGAMVVFAAIDPVSNWRRLNNPIGFLLPALWGNYYSELESLANEMGVVIVPRVMTDIWGNQNLTIPNDSFHPNASGHQVLTDRIYNVLANHLPNGNGSTLPRTIKIEAEDFIDASNDTSRGNSGGACTNPQFPDVDFERTSDIGGGCNLAYVQAGESIAYQVNIEQAANYVIKLRAASIRNSRARVLIDGNNHGQMTTNARGWQSFDSIQAGASINLEPGTHTIKIEFLDDDFNLNYLTIQASN
ncbi:GDSL-type esterase/lipase family protein [Agarilytica rhodophyticola]|uniref:GDSL-type esterase/lipase family protein n=1 Tax=Agarilytica rhodophyticola TaxID=1737490 RepID=UPI000B344C7E|nr:GDSL-type esterase/lipase family protein [Agarilytica rhodophyticola]